MINNQNTSTNFEYVFFFLLRTKLSTDDGILLDEPKSLGFDSSKQMAKQHGVPFERDKRLFFREAPPNAPLDKWAVHLKQSWQDICQLYAEQFGSPEIAQNYCSKALFGVTLLILDDGESVAQHSVHVTLQQSSLLRFVKPKTADFLFSISKDGDSKKATLHAFVPITSSGRAAPKNLRLSLTAEPQLKPLKPGEFQPNPVFLVCGFSYGGGDGHWKNAVEKLLMQTVPANRKALLATVFARLIMGQWQFKRMDEEARQLRSRLQPIINHYSNYANQDNGARPLCLRTRTLEEHLQDMQSHQTEAHLIISRLDGALQTLDINGDNLVTRLQQIRQETTQQQWQIHFQPGSEVEKLQWPPDNEVVVSLLNKFHLNIKNLEDHRTYLRQKVDYLEGLQEKWRLFLGKRRSLSSEHLNTLVTLLIIMLAGTGATFTINRGALGLDIVNQTLFWIILATVLFPIVWHFLAWIFRVVCCIFHGTWLDKFLCHNALLKKLRAIEFFQWVKTEKPQIEED